VPDVQVAVGLGREARLHPTAFLAAARSASISSWMKWRWPSMRGPLLSIVSWLMAARSAGG
jgi:hypothetical protein